MLLSMMLLLLYNASIPGIGVQTADTRTISNTRAVRVRVMVRGLTAASYSSMYNRVQQLLLQVPLLLLL